MIGLIAIAALLVGVAIVGWIHWHSTQNNPDTVFKQAITNGFMTAQVQAKMTAGDTNSVNTYDFSSLKNPLVSSQSTIIRYGAPFGIAGYGSATNTYISYTDLPSSVPAATVTSIKNAWVHVRSNGLLPQKVGANIAYVSDPRYQAFGAIIYGNFPKLTRDKLVQYSLNQHVYKYQLTQVTHQTVDGEKVLVFPVTINTGFLKILNISAANAEGFAPTDIQATLDNLDNLKESTVKIYVSLSSHRIVRLDVTKLGQTTSTVYGRFNSATVSDEPPTKLFWQDFAAVQLQMDLATAKLQTGQQLDVLRQSDVTLLQTYVNHYFLQYSVYPTFVNLNDGNWLAGNMNGLDPDALRDPLGNSWQLSPAPKAGSFAYQVTTDNAKKCDNNTSIANAQLCTIYLLTATLSNGKAYTLQNQ